MKGEDCSSICDGGVRLPPPGGASSRWANRAFSHQSTSEVCERERARGRERESGEAALNAAFHQGDIEPIPCSLVAWKTRADFHFGVFNGIGSCCRRVQITVLWILRFWYKKRAMCWVGVNSLDRSVAVCLLAKHEWEDQ